jgi:predicted site-specific integrase-resolvase
LYFKDNVSIIFKDLSSDIFKKKNICYARVSSDHQKKDLERQVEIIDRLCLGTEIIKDIGSDFKRKVFISLLDLFWRSQRNHCLVQKQIV